MMECMSPSGSLGVRREGPIHSGFGRRGSDVGVMMGTVATRGPVWRARDVCVRSTLQG